MNGLGFAVPQKGLELRCGMQAEYVEKLSIERVASLLCAWLCAFLLSAPTLATDCRFELLRDSSHQTFITRLLNKMARDRASGAAVSGGRVRKEDRGGKKSKLFEDAVIASYFRLSPPEQNDPKLVSKVLGDFLGVPPEVAEVVVAEYDLANSFRSSQVLETQLRQQIQKFFPLPPPETSRVPLGSGFIPDTWTRHLSKHSPAKRQFDTDKVTLSIWAQKVAGHRFWIDLLSG